MCPDLLRAVEREADGFARLPNQLAQSASANAGLTQLVQALRGDFASAPAQRAALARRLVQRLILTAQLTVPAQLMLEQAPHKIADAFISSRTGAEFGRVYGSLQQPELQQAIRQRA